jgi:hypothetical protein
MTCTREEKEAYEEFQRNRGDKVILFRMPFAEKMSLTNDQRSRSHIKGKVGLIKIIVLTNSTFIYCNL